MTTQIHSLALLSDDDLVAWIKRSAGDERRATAALVTALAELDARKLYLGAGCSSLFDKLRQAQDLLRHAIPTGDPAAIFDRALTLLLADAQRTKFASTIRPRAPRAAGPRSRRIPASVRREVWKRDGGRCAFVGANGRCAERGFLEFHHLVPYADGGSATVENLELRCRAHNAYEAARWSGGDTLFVKEQRATFWPTRSGTSLSLRTESAESASDQIGGHCIRDVPGRSFETTYPKTSGDRTATTWDMMPTLMTRPRPWARCAKPGRQSRRMYSDGPFSIAIHLTRNSSAGLAILQLNFSGYLVDL